MTNGDRDPRRAAVSTRVAMTCIVVTGPDSQYGRTGSASVRVYRDT